MVGSDIKIRRDPETKVYVYSRHVWAEKFISSPNGYFTLGQWLVNFPVEIRGEKMHLLKSRECVSGVYKLYKQRRSLTHSVTIFYD